MTTQVYNPVTKGFSQHDQVAPTSLTPRGYQQITPAVSTGLTVPENSSWALIQCENANVRWRDDGVDPTGSIGMLLSPGDTLPYTGDLSTLKLIGSGAIVNVSYYGE